MVRQCQLRRCSLVTVRSQSSEGTYLSWLETTSCTWLVDNWSARDDPRKRLYSPTKPTHPTSTNCPTTLQNSFHTIWTCMGWRTCSSALLTWSQQYSCWLMERTCTWSEWPQICPLIWLLMISTTWCFWPLWWQWQWEFWCSGIKPKRLNSSSPIGIDSMMMYACEIVW